MKIPNRFAKGKSRGQRSEVGRQGTEDRDRRSEIRGQKGKDDKRGGAKVDMT